MISQELQGNVLSEITKQDGSIVKITVENKDGIKTNYSDIKAIYSDEGGDLAIQHLCKSENQDNLLQIDYYPAKNINKITFTYVTK